MSAPTSASFEGETSLSTGSKYVLYLAGASFLLFGFFVASFSYRVLVSILKLFSNGVSKSVPKAKKISKTDHYASDSSSDAVVRKPANRGPDLKTLIKESKRSQANKGVGSKDDHASHHPLFINTLKGHGDVVHGIAWSSDGKQMVTACEDMYVRVFDIADITNREPKFRRIKTSRPPVGAGFADSSGQNISVVMKGIPDAVMAVYAPTTSAVILPTGKAAEGGNIEQLWQVDNVHGKETALAMRGVAPSPGRAGIIISLSTKKDLVVYNAQGRELAVLEPNSLGNHDLAVSLDGRFIAVASFTSEVKIWEVKVARDSGEITGVFKAMELKGHKKKVMSVALSPDNKRAITVSHDGTLRVWNIDVRYTFQEDPKTLLTIAMPLAAGRCYQRLAYGPTGIIAASHEGTIHLLSAKTGDLLDSIDAHDGTILEMHWCPKLLKLPGQAEPVAVLATCGRDKRVRMWRCPV